MTSMPMMSPRLAEAGGVITPYPRGFCPTRRAVTGGESALQKGQEPFNPRQMRFCWLLRPRLKP
jgi:hypothetical protein